VLLSITNVGLKARRGSQIPQTLQGVNNVEYCNYRFEIKPDLPRYVLLWLLLVCHLIFVPLKADPGDYEIYQDGRIVLGVGAAKVRMDSNIKITDKQSGDSLFLDLEGTLGLPSTSNVTNFYGGYQFNQNHAIGFGYFRINRSSQLIDFEGNLEDVVFVKVNATLTDKTAFTRLFYGYSLFRDKRSAVRILGGLYVLDFKYLLEAEGQITENGITESKSFRKDVSEVVPLPMFGFDFLHFFNPKWSLDTSVLFVGGSYQDVSATVLQTSIRGTYHATKHIGLDLGIAYFDADVTINEETERQDIVYGYDGISIGIHWKF